MLLTSDPHAWLRPYFATFNADPAYHTLAMPLRFAALRDVVEVDHPDRAKWMRECVRAFHSGTADERLLKEGREPHGGAMALYFMS